MDFSFIDDPQWKDLDDVTKQQVLDLSFQDQVASDPEWSNLDTDTQDKVKSVFYQDAAQIDGRYNQDVRDFNTQTKGDFSRGLSRGIDQTQGMLYGAAGLFGSIVDKNKAFEGDDTGAKIRDWGMEGYKRNMEEASLNPGTQLSDVEGVGSFIDYAQGLAGEFAPTMVEAALGSLVGGGAGTLVVRSAIKNSAKKYAKELVEDQIQKGIVNAVEKEAAQKILEKQFVKRAMKSGVGSQVKKRMAQGGMVGAVTALESGGNYGEVLEEHGIDNPYSALGFGALAASFELAGGNIRLIDNFIGAVAKKAPGNILKRTAKEILTNVPAEALQEAGQEVTSILNTVVNTDEKMLTPENVRRVFESGFAGGMMGGGGGLVRGVTSKRDDTLSKDEGYKPFQGIADRDWETRSRS